uniref:energy-coupling factor transporter transmembrane component T family protein n=1 Tax=Methanomethylophilus alvi TaxID=1291540 RepID=UPI0037DD099C
MFKDITVGQYLPGNSVVHRMDPRSKILLTLFIIVFLFMTNSFVGYGLFALLIFGTVVVAKIPMNYILRGLKPLILILVLTFGLHLFMDPGDVLFHIGPINATKQGLISGLMMVFRLILLIVTTSIMTLTTSPIDLTDGLERLMRPFQAVGVPAHELAMMMTIALRFIPTLIEETDKIMKAQMARGADFESGNIIRRVKSMIPVLVPLFVSAFRRADELALAMEARCYRGGKGRTRMKELKFSSLDAVTSGAVLVYVVLVTVLF